MSPHSYRNPLLLTLALDDDSQNRFQELRDQNFPPERNVVPAHVTLFHALPYEELEQVSDDLVDVSKRASFEIRVTKVRSMGRGVMYELESPNLLLIRNELAARWKQWIIPQDLQRYKPHVVIQNKVSAEVAQETFEQLSHEFSEFTVTGKGLFLWRYMDGPWELLRAFEFKQATIVN